MTTTNHVTVKALAQELGLDRSCLRKCLIKNGFPTFKVRTPDSRAQLTLALTPEDAEAVKKLRREQGYLEKDALFSGSAGNDEGYFYAIQLIPELDPLRIKLGFATSVESRLVAHRTAAPTAVLLKSWQCRRAWETAAIASITRTGCKPLSNEVYECDDIVQLILRADHFFALMP